MENAYARAGVDIEAGERAVEMMKAHVAKATRPEVIGGLGGFAGLFDASAFKNFDHPVLATSTDGVGTKIAIASAMGVFDTIGWDLMGMLVDDLVVCGAEPLFVTDYIACGKLVPERIAAIVSGIAQASAAAGAALVGGETAEHPGVMAPDDVDVAGATVGVVERDQILGPDRIQDGDALVALASSGLHSNGYSLVRRVLLEDAEMRLDQHIDDLGKTLGEELLAPTRVYAKDALAMIKNFDVRAMSHITGGGLANNLARVMPDHLTATVDRSTWAPAPIFDLVKTIGFLTVDDVESTLNMGVGMVVVVAPEQASAAVDFAKARGIDAWQLGTIGARVGGQAVSMVSAQAK